MQAAHTRLRPCRNPSHEDDAGSPYPVAALSKPVPRRGNTRSGGPRFNDPRTVSTVDALISPDTGEMLGKYKHPWA
jgi:hypothetical protein